jgi:hypothetical protein
MDQNDVSFLQFVHIAVAGAYLKSDCKDFAASCELTLKSVVLLGRDFEMVTHRLAVVLQYVTKMEARRPPFCAQK